MSELNLCSRREADKLISQSRVLVNGVPVDTLGSKVSHLETNIRILDDDEDDSQASSSGSGSGSGSGSQQKQYQHLFDWDKIRGDTVVLHKPKKYVSGQPDPKHGHLPAVQLLTRPNIYFPDFDSDAAGESSSSSDAFRDSDVEDLKYTLSSGKYLHFARKKIIRSRHSHRQGGSSSSRFHNNNNNDDDHDDHDDDNSKSNKNNNLNPSTLMKYAPAGRLDLDSTGVLIFTKNGTIAKHILSPKTEKEYIAHVEPVYNISREEKQKGMVYLPYPPVWDLSVLKRGGKRLWNDRSAMRPLVGAEWIEEGTGKNGQWDGTGKIKFILQEGKKRQIRRMCREVLGLNVRELVRTRVGSVKLDDLPVGRWRTLTEREVRSLLE